MEKKTTRILHSIEEAKQFIAERKAELAAGKIASGDPVHYKVGTLTGSFDGLHMKHVDVIVSAEKQCDILIMAITPNSAITPRKSKPGDKRPKFDAEARASHIQDFGHADAVLVIGEGQTNVAELWANMLKELKPDISFIGGDRKTESLQVPEGTELRFVGGDDYTISTTRFAEMGYYKRLEDFDLDPDISLINGRVVSMLSVPDSHPEAFAVTMTNATQKDLVALRTYIRNRLGITSEIDVCIMVEKGALWVEGLRPTELHAVLSSFAEGWQDIHRQCSSIREYKSGRIKPRNIQDTSRPEPER